MADSLSQAKRSATLTTPLGATVLVLARMTAIEGLSELFETRVEAISTTANLDFNSTLGLGAAVTLNSPDGSKRYFNGLMTEAYWRGVEHKLYRYELVLRPWLWFLTRTSDCRIFANKNALDIVKEVFSKRGFTDFRDATTEAPPKMEYCVQYRETDFNFVCRLMEEYGIYYFFEHEESKHTLVLADSKSSHKPAPGLVSVEFNPVTLAGRRAKQGLDSWSRGRRAQTGKYVLNEYDYNKPPAVLLATSDKPGSYAHASMERYDYPGRYVEKSVGETLAKVKVEAGQSQDERRSCAGVAPSLFPGALVTTKLIEQASENQEYLVTRCSHVIREQAYRSAGREGAAEVYSGSYEFTPSSLQFRAPLVTPKPMIAGPHSARVIGKDGEKIDVDELGRILVHFYWDREDKPSRRVRVAQIWAGQQRGALFVPRIGDEVMVAYEDGDPDRPIVVGSVYNGTNTVPMDLPGKKNNSGILTRSTKGDDGYNMLLFNDTSGSEVVKIRAQKDFRKKALHDELHEIGNDQTEKIGNDVTKSVGNNETVDIGNVFQMTAQSKIVLIVGNSTITMEPSKITFASIQIETDAQATIKETAMSVAISGGAEVTITTPKKSISA